MYVYKTPVFVDISRPNLRPDDGLLAMEEFVALTSSLAFPDNEQWKVCVMMEADG